VDPRGVAVQVAFERHILKPVFHLMGARVETRRLSAMGSYGSGGVNVHCPAVASTIHPSMDLAGPPPPLPPSRVS
jgi:hypothetical protein